MRLHFTGSVGPFFLSIEAIVIKLWNQHTSMRTYTCDHICYIEKIKAGPFHDFRISHSEQISQRK